MTDKKHIDIKGMKERIAEDHNNQKQAFSDTLQAMSERVNKERAESTALFHKALQASYEEDKKVRDAEVEEAKQQAMKEVEARFERETGVKSDESLKRDAALRGMLQNMAGMND